MVCKSIGLVSSFCLNRFREISQKFNRFLWNGRDGEAAKAKVAWSDVAWNISSVMRRVWSLFAWSGSLWVAWVKEYLLKGRSFRNISVSQNCSWSWRKLLGLRQLARGFIKFEVGDRTN
jgi:hypothetical protein